MTKVTKVEWNGIKNAIMQVTYFLNSPMANLLFYFIFFYTERKWLHKRNFAAILLFNSKLSAKFQRFKELMKLSKCWKIGAFPKITIKGTLMQIWKSPYMFAFIWKQYSGNFAFLILKTIELFARKVCAFLKKKANF